MSAHQDFIPGNELYVSTFDKGHLPLPPSKKVAVVTCMDARIEPATQLGINLGEAHVIRNAGGSAKEALRSVVISQRLLGTREVAVFHHTDCGMLTFTNEQLHEKVKAEAPGNAAVAAAVDAIDFLPFSQLEESVKEDVAFLKENPLILDGTILTGWVYDVTTGKWAGGACHMDELVRHCLRELAFDGDLGSDVSRLKDFIAAFYAHANASHTQSLDDAFYSFIWSLVVQQPTVLVGLVPEGVTSEVWVAPQVSAKRKAQARGEDHVETTPPKLDPIPDSKTAPLDTLRRTYGDRLRIAAEPEAIFAAITGSHIRSSKMSPMVYSTLQIVTRGRDNGVSVVELGRKSGYDQKTCFYLVRQLTEMDLILKVRRGGVGTHFCVHKYFFERSSSWKSIVDEETQAESLQNKLPSAEDDLIVEESNVENPQLLNFTPIDARHLSSFPLISNRVIRLLKASRNHMHASNNMLVTLGFPNPTKTDRRFFQSRIREMVQQGLIEKVVVPNTRSKSSDATVKCFRLLDQGADTKRRNDIVLSDEDEDLDDTPRASQSGVKLNSTVHKQLIDLLEESGTTGMTLNVNFIIEFSSSLGQFDKRTIELLLARADRSRPPVHLSDWHVAGLMETNGRERRHRYYTVANYRKLVTREELDKTSAGYQDIDLSHSGEFYPIDAGLFYQTQKDLTRYSDSFKGAGGQQPGTTKKRVFKNPILPNGQVKRGRPRKCDIMKCMPEEPTKQSSRKRKREPSPPPPPPNLSSVVYSPLDPNGHGDATASVQEVSAQEIHNQPPAKRRRGRPPKTESAPAVELTPCKVQVVSVPQKERPQHLRKGKNGALHQDDLQPIVEGRQTRSRSKARIKETPASAPDDDDGDVDDVPKSIEVGESDANKDLPKEPISDRDRFESTDAQPLPMADSPCTDQSQTTVPIPSVGHGVIHVSPRPQLSVSSLISTPLPATLPNHGRVNVSHLRRENEIMRLIANAGGLVNTQSGRLYEDHVKLLESLAAAGEPASSPPGTKTDKRTMISTLDSLERKGRIKQLRTSFTPRNSIASRATCIAYLPDTDQSRLNAFLADLARPALQSATPSVKKIEDLEIGASSPTTPRVAPALQRLQAEQPATDRNERWSKNVNRANQLFNRSDQEIRDILLAEHTTASQFFGYVIGKAMRCRQLHLSILQFLDSLEVSPIVVSKEKRIIDISLLCSDLPLGLYCSLVSPLSFNKDLATFFSSEAGRATAIKDLPQELQAALQFGKSRPRSRFLDMLEVLRCLGLVIPLQASTSDTPFITCFPNGNHPTRFDQAGMDEYTSNIPMNAFTYWQCQEFADIHVWSAPETQPPFWKSVSVKTHSDGIAYWRDLHEACINFETDIEVPAGPKSNYLPQALGLGDRYVMQFLKRYVDPSGSTPLQIQDDQERETELRRISWVVSTPQGVVEDYFSAATKKISRNVERSKHKTLKEQKRKEEDAKKSLVRKAEEARLQREQEWLELLCNVHPEEIRLSAAVRIERVRQNYLQAGSVKDVTKWEKEIQSTLREAELVSSTGLKMPTKSFLGKRTSNAHPTSSTAVPSEMSIHELIDQVDTHKKRIRRHRFQWNPDFDELARDASVIIRARCRGLARVDWGAFEQVFPAVPRNTVRQRLVHIKETPGNEAYLRRLEDAWYDIWRKHKGTPLLPDNIEDSPSDFDLIKHVEFLRNHIDKNALCHEDFICPASESEGIVLAEAALKMVMGTPSELYESDIASTLLRSRGNDAVSTATKNLLARSVLSKLQRDATKPRPGRQLKISESNQNAAGGSVSRDTFQDAVSLLEELDPHDSTWHEWPLTATDGDCATLIQLVSEDKIDFEIDTSLAQAARPALDWNSKKADDDQIETTLKVRYDFSTETRESVSDETPVISDSVGQTSEAVGGDDEHGLNASGSPACCRRNLEERSGLVDCAPCLREAWQILITSLDRDVHRDVEWLMDVVRQAGEVGIRKSELAMLCSPGETPIMPLVIQLTEADVPQAYWVGYDTLVLIAANAIPKWSVVVSDNPLVHVFPRRWLDINGQRVGDFWQAALRAVMGGVIFRPGITQAQLRWRLRSAYDRQEIIEVVRYLHEEGFLQLRIEGSSTEVSENICVPFDEDEESRAYWFIGDRRWYQV
ncbi:hypothetical protein NLJ89_g5025 [Agrocybe chaxingu]|uniref:Transcription factor tau subunit sfc3/Tfc3 C-terminal domain-containing protein n=1 Tax=Agrocybe chaxingu TaxID=84603 RepID=A0A9W8MU03_9AGAR|nr:hypothetical protein NLJ89_g5025 [Agrocybe chaxingu]